MKIIHKHKNPVKNTVHKYYCRESFQITFQPILSKRDTLIKSKKDYCPLLLGRGWIFVRYLKNVQVVMDQL